VWKLTFDLRISVIPQSHFGQIFSFNRKPSLRDTLLTHSETVNLKHENCDKRGFIKQDNVCWVHCTFGAVYLWCVVTDRRLPCAAPTTTVYPDTPTFYIDSSNDPGLSQPGWSYGSFNFVRDLLRAWEVIWGSFIFVSKFKLTGRKHEWGVRGETSSKAKGTTGATSCCTGQSLRNVVFSEMFYAIIVWINQWGYWGGDDGWPNIFKGIFERKYQVQLSANPDATFASP